MPKLFTDLSTKKMSAKDYINKKRNLTLYNDFGNNGVSRKIAQQYNNGKLKNVINHENLLNLTKGYYDHYQTQDISSALFQTYDSQVFRSECEYTKQKGATNYTGKMLLNNNTTDAGTQSLLQMDTKFSDVNHYGEIIETTNATLTDNKKTDKVKCFQYPLPKLHKKTC